MPQTSLPNSFSSAQLCRLLWPNHAEWITQQRSYWPIQQFLFQSFFIFCWKNFTHVWKKKWKMSALFNFSSLLTVILLLICTCAYLRSLWPNLLDRRKTGPMGTFWKFARVGERLSPYVALFCIGMAFHTLFISAWKFKEDRTL